MSNYIDVIPPQERVMTLLRHGVPITLLADLLEANGPPSAEIYRTEAVADDVRREAARPVSQRAAVRSSDFAANEAAC